MEIRVNNPPVLQPPDTYDILGLTRTQFKDLCSLLADTPFGGPLQSLYDKAVKVAAKAGM